MTPMSPDTLFAFVHELKRLEIGQQLHLSAQVLALPISAYDVLTRFCAIAREEPKRIRMHNWLYTFGGAEKTEHQGAPACGMIGCVSGWCALLLGQPQFHESWYAGDFVPTMLGLNDEQRKQLMLPDPLMGSRRREFNQTTQNYKWVGLKSGTRGYARAVVRHVRRFQAEYEDQLKGTIITQAKIDAWFKGRPEHADRRVPAPLDGAL